MRIWLLKIGETLPLQAGTRKARTALLADVLAERGHEVIWWSSAFDHFNKEWISSNEREVETEEGVKIILLRGCGYSRNVSLARFLDHRLLASAFRKQAVAAGLPQVIVASLPSYDLAYEASRYARRNGIPLAIDIRDQWPDIFLDHIPPLLRSCARLALIRDFRMVRESMRSADSLISMMDSMLSWGLTYARRERRPSDRVFYLGAPKMPEPPDPSLLAPEIGKKIDDLRGLFVVTFVGTFANYHDPSILVDAARSMKDERAFFILAGSGQLEESIRKRCAGLSNVWLPGWLNEREIQALLLKSHVGVCPTGRTASFFPNKAFSYFSAGFPVISAFEGEFRNILSDKRLGLFYQPDNCESLISCIRKLKEDSDLYGELAGNVTAAFQSEFDAAKIYRDYADHVEALAERRYSR